MDEQSGQDTIAMQRVAFPNGNEALVVMPHAEILPDAIVHALRIPRPGALILIAGGATDMGSSVFTHLAPLFSQGVADLAVALDALIIDGGTHAGVMALTGEGVAARQYRSPLLGIAPEQSVIYPGKISDASDLVPLDPNHSHFVLVHSAEWGGETETMYALAQHFSQQSPSVAVLADGGKITKKELLFNVRQRRPVIVIEGSGRLADEIACLWREKPSSFSDSELAEIITQGDLHLFPLSGSHLDFMQLLQRQLER